MNDGGTSRWYFVSSVSATYKPRSLEPELCWNFAKWRARHDMTEAPKPFLREAKFPEDFDAILEVSRKAFQLDPAVMFWGNVKEVSLES